MSDIFGTPRQPKPSGRGGADRRRRVLVPTLVTLAVLLFLGSIFTSVWTDRLWYKSVDYQNVFSTMVFTRVGLFLVLGLLFGLVVALNVYLAYRFRPRNLAPRRDDPAFRYRTAMEPVRKPALIVLTLVVTAFAGSVGQSRWDTFQLWRHGTSFGIKDPQFGKDQGFYVFDYPWLRFLASFSFALVVVTVLATLFVLYVYGGVRIAGRGPSFTRAAQVQLSVLVGIGVLVRAFGYWLDRYGCTVKSSGLINGCTYTDVHARIPSRNILIAVAIVCALLFFATVFLKSWVLPGIGLGLMLVTSILLGGVWPYVMQSFQVKPSEPDKEGPYIGRNIEATREAYGVKDTEVRQYSAQTKLTPQELNESAEDRVSSRLIDPTLVSEAFQQLQQVRGYYTVQSTLDVDRYKIGKNQQPQDVIIAAREVNLNGLQETQRKWANDHTVYTHGYGVIAAKGNQRGAQGNPVWVEKDIPPVGDIPTKVPPRIYFGENTPSYSIVGRPDGAKPVEVDIPRGNSSGDDGAKNATLNTYDGKGGVPIGNLFTKVLYAFKFAEPNIVLSERVNENSKILYDRNPRDRVKKVAPWLTVDGDTYPAVVDGRVVWVVDGYTTSNSYAYSEHRSLREATDDTLTQGRAQAALPTDQVNYMRNSVKAVVDAYDGSVKLYQWDTKDPVLKTWMKVFPGVVEKKSEISADLKSHLRYPVDLFKVQRDILTRYHVTDAQTFYNGDERWKIPEDPATTATRDTLQPPYYLSMTRPGQASPKFSLTSVYLPNSRDNLASFMSVNSEASDKNFGKLQILQLPSNTQIDGPSQVANDFQTDKGVTQALLQYEQSRQARILRGNLLTLPVGDALLYVQPVYIQRSSASGSYPVLQFVAATFGDEVGFGQTLDEALRVSLGLEQGTIPSDDGESSGDSGGSSKGKTPNQYLEDASKRYSEAQKALKDGNLAEYQSKIKQMNDAIESAQDALKDQKK